MIWQEGPQGNLSYLPTGTETEGIPDFKAVTELAPGQQRLYDSGVASQQKFADIASSQLGQVQNKLSQPFDMSQFGAAPRAPMIRGGGMRYGAYDHGMAGGNMDPNARPSSVPGGGVSMAAPQRMAETFHMQPDGSLGLTPPGGADGEVIAAPDYTQMHQTAQPGYPQQGGQQHGRFGPAPEVNPEVRQRQQDAILQRFQPQLDRNSDAERTRLANQGFVRGSEGFRDAMFDDNQARNDFYLGADIQAGDEMARMFGLQNASRARDINEMNQDYIFETNARDRAIQEEILSRGQPMSELSTFMTGSQPKDPRFVPTPQGTIAAPNFLDATYASAGQQNAFNQNQAGLRNSAQISNNQGLYGLAGTGAKLYGASQGWGWGK